MSQIDMNLDLLACILAMQARLLRRDVLLVELRDWVKHRTGPFSSALRERGILTDLGHGSLGSLLQRELARHAGDAARCLSSLEVEDSFRRELEQIADRDLLDSVRLIGRARLDDPASTKCDASEEEDGVGGSSLFGDEPTQAGVVSDPGGLERTQFAPSVPEDPSRGPGPAETWLIPPDPSATRGDAGGSTCPGRPADSFLTLAPSPADSLLTRAPSSSPSEAPATSCDVDPADRIDMCESCRGREKK
jgi:hypothetical protein